jgi:hypothetical protein
METQMSVIGKDLVNLASSWRWAEKGNILNEASGAQKMKSRTKYVLIDSGTEVGDQPRGFYQITGKRKDGS